MKKVLFVLSALLVGGAAAFALQPKTYSSDFPTITVDGKEREYLGGTYPGEITDGYFGSGQPRNFSPDKPAYDDSSYGPKGYDDYTHSGGIEGYDKGFHDSDVKYENYSYGDKPQYDDAIYGGGFTNSVKK